MRADSLGHLAPRNKKPIISMERPQADVIHLTSVRPVIRRYDWVQDEHEDFKRQALSNEDVIHIQRVSDIPDGGTRIGLLFGLQNAPSGLTSAHHVRTLVERGVRFMSLAHGEERNEYGSGFLNAKGGLTREGKSVIRWMGEYGMILDVSHMNDETAVQALTLIKTEKIPMVPLASHSGIREAFNHARNLPREVLELLRTLNGYVGLSMRSYHVCTRSQLPSYSREFMYHVAHALVWGGAENIGIGSDCIHRNMTMLEAKSLYDATAGILKTRGQFGEYFPDRPEQIIEEGAKLLPLMHELIRSTLSVETADSICGNNFVNYLGRALPP